jgi:hypothetical protein
MFQRSASTSMIFLAGTMEHRSIELPPRHGNWSLLLAGPRLSSRPEVVQVALLERILQDLASAALG